MAPTYGGGYILTVSGSGFLPGAQIVIDGTVMTATTRISGGELQVALTAEPAGTVLTVTAENAVPGSPVEEASQKIPVTIGGGKLVILQTQPWPSPYTGGPGWVSVNLEGPADDLVLKVYSKAMVLVGASDAGPQPAGWVSVALPTDMNAGVANGLYYYTVSAERGGQWIHPVVGRMYVLR